LALSKILRNSGLDFLQGAWIPRDKEKGHNLEGEVIFAFRKRLSIGEKKGGGGIPFQVKGETAEGEISSCEERGGISIKGGLEKGAPMVEGAVLQTFAGRRG